MTSKQPAVRIWRFVGLLFTVTLSSPTIAQEIRYSYLDMSFMGQDVDETGSETPVPGQTVDYDASDGSGIRFRGSIGTWHNLYLFLDYSSVDIDLSAFVVSPLIPNGETVKDEFDFTNVRGGVGLKYSIGTATDVYGEITYDSADLDFGSFALENFDTGEKDFGAALGIRRMMNDNLELRAWGRYTNLGDVNLNTLYFDTDTLIGAGFGWELIRGFSIVGDYESGEFGSWSIGFRLDLDED